MPNVATNQEEAVMQLFNEYIKTVDAKNIHKWPELFAEEASYIVIARENVEKNLPLAFVHDHTKDRILDRVTTITKVWHGHINDYWPRHLCSNVSVHLNDRGEAELTANFAVYVTEPNNAGSRVLAVGEYIDCVIFEGDEPKFKSKKVILDTTVLPRYFVYPL